MHFTSVLQKQFAANDTFLREASARVKKRTAIEVPRTKPKGIEGSDAGRADLRP